MYELLKCVYRHTFPGEAYVVTAFNSSSSDLGAGSLYVFPSTIIQMVSRGFTSREPAGCQR